MPRRDRRGHACRARSDHQHVALVPGAVDDVSFNGHVKLLLFKRAPLAKRRTSGWRSIDKQGALLVADDVGNAV